MGVRQRPMFVVGYLYVPEINESAEFLENAKGHGMHFLYRNYGYHIFR